MEVVGFILVGMLIGACLVTLMSIWIYHQSCPNYTERETGVVWYLKTIAKDGRKFLQRKQKGRKKRRKNTR